MFFQVPVDESMISHPVIQGCYGNHDSDDILEFGLHPIPRPFHDRNQSTYPLNPGAAGYDDGSPGLCPLARLFRTAAGPL